MGVPSFAGRIGLAGAAHSHVAKRTLEGRDTCDLSAGDLYVYPNSTSVIDATKPLTFEWDTSCVVATSTIDLYLYESAGLIHAWTGVTFSDGKYEATLLPKWWNDTTTAQLQMSIIDSGAYSWDTSSPAGPVFTVNYAASAMYSTTTANGQVETSTAAAAATQSKDATFESVTSTGKDKGISKGAIAAAVIVPLLVLCVVAGVAVRFWRAREAEKRRRWSQALSSHSNLEWEKGALPGEKPQSILGRPSIGGRSSMGGGRPSMSSYGGNGIRPTSSVYAVENNMAGAGAGPGRHLQRPSMGNLRSHSADNVNQVRSSVVMPNGEVRQSRISFAETARPDRRSRLSFGGDIRANVQSGVFRMPGASRSASDITTPNRKSLAYATGSALDDEEEDMNISPSQMQGPHGFAEADMRRAGAQKTGRRSMLSWGGDKRRESTASALSADDFKSAASARGSVDELRDMEAIMLMRRSMISQGSNSPNLQYSTDPATLADAEEVEALDNDATSAALPSAPSPIAGASTVAFGPDQMLAVYAARGKVSSPAPMTTSGTAPLAAGVVPPKPTASRQNSGMRLLTNLGKKVAGDNSTVTSPTSASEGSMPPPPIPTEMKSYVHLNKGTVSSAVVDALPHPGPRGVTSPTGERPALNLPSGSGARASGMSDGSRYSEVADDSVGEAK